jgi:uncharacterized protein YjbI with pentapeptide repeats
MVMREKTHILNTRAFFRILGKKQYADFRYQECRYFATFWTGCVWENCHFYRVGYFWGCTFHGCVFRNCLFRGQHTYLGASFKNCQFINCDFTDVSFGRASFTDCRITGTLTNIIFHGNEAPRSWRTRFTRVDLSGAKLIDTGFQSGLKKEEIIT